MAHELVARVPGPSTQHELPYGTGPTTSSSTTRDFTSRPVERSATRSTSSWVLLPRPRSASVGGSSARAAHSPEHVLPSSPVEHCTQQKVVNLPKNRGPPHRRLLENVATLAQQTSGWTPPNPNVEQQDGTQTGGTTKQFVAFEVGRNYQAGRAFNLSQFSSVSFDSVPGAGAECRGKAPPCRSVNCCPALILPRRRRRARRLKGALMTRALIRTTE